MLTQEGTTYTFHSVIQV